MEQSKALKSKAGVLVSAQRPNDNVPNNNRFNLDHILLPCFPFRHAFFSFQFLLPLILAMCQATTTIKRRRGSKGVYEIICLFRCKALSTIQKGNNQCMDSSSTSHTGSVYTLPEQLMHSVIFTSQVVSKKGVQEVVTVALKPL